LFLPVVAVPDDAPAPDGVPEDDTPCAVPVAVAVVLREEDEALGEPCILCGEQKFQVGNNKLATKIIRIS
jgi:hypothetical protein